MTLTKNLMGIASAFVVSAALQGGSSVFAETSNWSDSIKVSGDFRYRFENTDQEGSEDRDRSRFRARIKLDAKVNETVKFGIRLASGGDGPISTNQTADKFASTKDFGIDRAFVAWTPVEGSTILAGKFATPFYASKNSQMLWDGDLNPEGLAYKFTRNGFFANVARFNLDECSSCDDSYLNGIQAGYTYKIANGSQLTFGVGQFDFDLNATELEIPDAYSESQIFADYSMKLYDKPLLIHANYVVNADGEKIAQALGISDELDSAFEVGFNYGKAKNAGEWEFRYNYKEVDAFSVFPLWSDSDFAGGGADNDGHQLDFRYAVNKNFTVGLRHFINERNLSSTLDLDPLTNPIDYNRTFLDFNYKF